MLIDVQDPRLNLVLNACFFASVLLALVSIVPWRSLDHTRLSHALRWLVAPCVALAVAYEWAMPDRFDIRIDLLVLVPAYLIVLMTSIVRWWGGRRRKAEQKAS